MSIEKYTESHEWLRKEGDDWVVGVTEFAQQQLGDIVFVELPEVGESYQVGDELVVIESVKAAGEVVTPVAGVVTSINDAAIEEPALINEAPEGDGWLFKIKLVDESALADLMDREAYLEYIA